MTNEQPDPKENKCDYCGFESYNTFCTTDCDKADKLENCR